MRLLVTGGAGYIGSVVGALLVADGVDAVLHLAAKSLVGESMAQPSLYWGNNLGGSLALLEAMRAAGTPRI